MGFEIENGVLKKYTEEPGVTEVTIPNSVTSIGDCAFKYCENLVKIKIPDGVTSIGAGAFSGCKKLNKITIPFGVKKICNFAFDHCSSLTSIKIPDSVTHIGSESFAECDNLSQIIIPNSVTDIGDKAFYSCGKLTEITLSDSMTYICYGLFSECGELTKITIPHGVTNIGKNAFFRCENLTDIKISDSVTYIGSDAFAGCRNLTDIKIPDSVTYIGTEAFAMCENLTEITLSNGATTVTDRTFSDCCKLTHIKIPNGVTSIGDSAFKNCSHLTEITIPDSVTGIGKEAFFGCKNLADKDGFFIVNNTLCWCAENSPEITLPEGITSIVEGAFSECKNLTRIVMSDSVFKSGEIIPIELAPYIKLTESQIPYAVMFQNGKKWTDLFHSNINKTNADAVIAECAALLETNPAITKKSCNALVKLIEFYLDYISSETLEKVAEQFVARKIKCDMITEKVKKNKKQSDSSSIDEAEKNKCDDELEKIVDTYLTDTEYYKKAVGLTKRGIKFKNSEERCSGNFMAVFIAECIKIWSAYSKPVWGDFGLNKLESLYSDVFRDLKICDAFFDRLDKDELMTFLKESATGKDYRYFIIPFCRYADEKLITFFISSINEAKRGYARERLRAASSVTALLLSDTKSAAFYLEKNKRVDEYIKLRKITEDEFRAKYFYTVDLDENGKKVYELGKKKVEVSLKSDLTFTLFDLDANKEVKSIPKKDSDANQYEAAKKDFSELKTAVKKIAKSVIGKLFAEFLSGKEYTVKEWQNYFSVNPVLKNIAKLIVWAQDSATFVISPAGYEDADGNVYALKDTKIVLAHPMEMGKTATEKWQNYFVAHKLKQPFDQIWEPVINQDKFSGKVYEGCEIPLFRFNNQEKHGIIFDSGTYFNFRQNKNEYEYIDITMKDCSFEWTFSSGSLEDATIKSLITVKSFKILKTNRQANHIIIFLDRCTVYARIEKDDDSVIENLAIYTAVQIDAFLNYAVEKGAVKCAAAFLNYKNEHFADYSYLDSFTLDFI